VQKIFLLVKSSRRRENKQLIYQVTGHFNSKSNKVTITVNKADIKISYSSFNPEITYVGYFIDSNSITGTLNQPTTDHWMAIRKQNK
jgi:hypothetical protein